MTPAEATAIAALGERRIRERRATPMQPDLTTGFINRLTADRDRLKAEVAMLRDCLSAAKIAAKGNE